MLNTPTLGELLRNKISLDEAEAARRSQENPQPATEQARAEAILTEFFDGVKFEFTSQIRRGQSITPVYISRRQGAEVAALLQIESGPCFVLSKHPYYKFWRDFADWAASNELMATWTSAHAGEEKAYMLSVQPVGN